MLELVDDEGWDALSVRRVCERAGLTRRYFYESFTDLDALAGSVFADITDEIAAAAAALPPGLDLHERIRTALDAQLAALTPSQGRFLILSQRLPGAIAPARADAVEKLATILAGMMGETGVSSADLLVPARMVVGAILALVESWYAGELSYSREHVADTAATAATALIRSLTTPGTDSAAEPGRRGN